MVKKAAAERMLIKFSFLAIGRGNPRLFSMESNRSKMKLHFQSSSFSLDISELCRWHVYSLFLRPLNPCFKIFLTRSYRICSNFAKIEATKGGISSLKRFLKKTPGTE